MQFVLFSNDNFLKYHLYIYILFFLGTGSVTPLLQSYEKEQKYFIPGDQNDDKIDRIVSQNDIKSGNTTQIIKMEKVALPLTGAGRLLKLEQGMPLAEALEVIKIHLKLSHVRLAIANNATKGKGKKLVPVKIRIFATFIDESGTSITWIIIRSESNREIWVECIT